MPSPPQQSLRAITYLSPGIPLEFFEAITHYLGKVVGRVGQLESDERISGPMHGEHDPFAAGRADLGFVCSPSFLYLRSLATPSVELLPVGFVFDDARNQGRPHYFSDVIVRADRDVTQLDQLRDGVFGFNDTCSLSGYFAVRQELANQNKAEGFFSAERCTGSHAASIRAVLDGEIDVAAIDSNVLALAYRSTPDLRERLRVIESWGPHPIQPIVLSTRAAELMPTLTQALLEIMDDAEFGPSLRRFGLARCVPIDEDLYAEERAALIALDELHEAPTG